MSTTGDDDRATTDDTAEEVAHDVLEAFNAEEVVDAPGEPPADVEDPADDADAPAP